MAIGRCSKETVQKVLVAAEAVCLIRKTANARGGRHPRPATYACTLPLGADPETGHGIAWGKAAAVLSSSEHDRRLRHKRAKDPGRHVTPPDRSPVQEHGASYDAPLSARTGIEAASHDKGRERHVTDQKALRDGPTRYHQALHQDMGEVVCQPQVDGTLPSATGRGDPHGTATVPAQGYDNGRSSEVAASTYMRHVAACDRCPWELWCPQGSRLRKYLRCPACFGPLAGVTTQAPEPRREPRAGTVTSRSRGRVRFGSRFLWCRWPGDSRTLRSAGGALVEE